MRDAFKDITEAARGLWRNRKMVLLFFATYIALLGTIALFVTTREATLRQVALTFVTLLAAPALFFLLQAMCVNYTETDGASEMLRRSLKSFWKLMLVSIPVIIIALALYLLLGRIEATLVPQAQLQGQLPRAASQAEWPRVIFSTLRLLLFGIIVPLINIHLWLALMRGDAPSALRNLKSILAKAFAARSVLTYVFGFILFGVLPYVMMMSRTPFERPSVEITVLVARLILAFCFMLLGWVITVGALNKGMRAEG
jgi:hypothetical protein